MAKAGRLVVCQAILAATVYAQTPNAQITGRIGDPSGAAVPDVRVTVTDTDRRTERTSDSNETGTYRVPFLQPGNYEVRFEKQGLRPLVRSGISLVVDQVARLDVTLEVGAITQQVEVTAEAPQVDSETSSLGHVIDNKRINELPLNGRNVMSLVQLAAGVQPYSGINGAFADTGNFNESNLSINGGRGSLNALLFDGVNNAAQDGRIAVSPSVDAVQEFKVYTNGASAEFGRTSGGVVSLITKSGTNALHGTLYEFLRNDGMDARDAFATTKGVLRYNQFGGTIGGPVVLPKIYKGKDRTFFFFSYEGWRDHFPANNLVSVPTAAQRAGDFSTTFQPNGRPLPIYDPETTVANPAGGFNRSPFPGNIIPTNRFDRIAVGLMNRVPLPNQTPANAITNVQNYFEVNQNATDNDQFLGRFDHNLNQNQRQCIGWLTTETS